MNEEITSEPLVFPTASEVAEAAAGRFVTATQEAIAERGTFHVALSGGGTPLGLYRLLASPPRLNTIDWGRVHVFFSDERCVPEGHPDRNDRQASEALLDHVPIPAENIIVSDVTAPDATERYELAFRGSFQTPPGVIPRFDLILLGIGSDGHTASLFPGHPALEETKCLVMRIEDSPKPPPDRITFTLPLINAARLVVVLATGAGKHDVVLRALQGDRLVPAGRVKPTKGRLLWLIDEAAWTGLTLQGG